jgi:hypothetical protein
MTAFAEAVDATFAVSGTDTLYRRAGGAPL